MIAAAAALSAIPSGLRDPLLTEYQTIVQNWLEQRWLPSELHGGRFSEIVYTILDGQAKGKYAPKPAKPANFPDACKKLESNAHVPRSFQILIPRMLPALYEVRNNRNVGHVGGDVDPNHMDSMAVLSMANWIMAELVRVFHGLTIVQAQQVVDTLAEVRIPIVWSDGGGIKRVLRPELKLHEQILILASVSVPDVTSKELIEWIEEDDKGYFIRTIRNLHKKRLVEFTESTDKVKILPPRCEVRSGLDPQEEAHRNLICGKLRSRTYPLFFLEATPNIACGVDHAVAQIVLDSGNAIGEFAAPAKFLRSDALSLRVYVSKFPVVNEERYATPKFSYFLPHRPPTLTAASPSENSIASSKRGLITN